MHPCASSSWESIRHVPCAGDYCQCVRHESLCRLFLRDRYAPWCRWFLPACQKCYLVQLVLEDMPDMYPCAGDSCQCATSVNNLRHVGGSCQCAISGNKLRLYLCSGDSCQHAICGNYLRHIPLCRWFLPVCQTCNVASHENCSSSGVVTLRTASFLRTGHHQEP